MAHRDNRIFDSDGFLAAPDAARIERNAGDLEKSQVCFE